jgi:hypothetical protein
MSNQCITVIYNGTQPSTLTCNTGSTITSTATYCASGSITLPSCAATATSDHNVNPSISGTCYYCTTTSIFSSSSTTSTSNPVPSPTTSQTPTSISSPTTTPGSKLLTPGKSAGIGIGCAFVGALLAGLIVFFLSRRKQKRASYQDQHLSIRGGYVEQEKRNIASTKPHAAGGLVTNVDRLLPQPAEDDVIIGGLSKIRDSIKNHVQNYYHSTPVSPQMVDETRLSELARATTIPTSALLGLLLNPTTRVPMIRLFLAHFILSRCSPRIDGIPSFLPNEVSALAASQTQSDVETAGEFDR